MRKAGRMDYNRLEPYNEDAETNLIASVLSNPDQAHRALSTLDENDFYYLYNRKIYRAIKDITENGKEPDYLNIKDWLKVRQIEDNDNLEKYDEIFGLSDIIESSARMIKEKSSLRKLIRLGERISNDCFTGTRTAEEIIEDQQTELCEIFIDYTQKTKKNLVLSPSEYSANAISRAEKLYQNPDVIKEEEILTGLDALDRITGGAKDINIISASTGVGKTALALNLAIQFGVRKNIPTLYLNYEMAINQLSNRLISIISGVRFRSIETGKYERASEEFDKVCEASKKLKESKLFITDNDAKTINTTLSLIEKYAISHGLKVIFIDYLGEISMDKLGSVEGSEYITYGRWIQSLKGTCQKYGIKLYILVQQNRMDKESSDGVGGSYKILQKADQFILLYEKNRKVIMKLDKNRHGPYPFKWYVKFDKSNQRMSLGKEIASGSVQIESEDL